MLPHYTKHFGPVVHMRNAVFIECPKIPENTPSDHHAVHAVRFAFSDRVRAVTYIAVSDDYGFAVRKFDRIRNQIPMCGNF